MGRRFQAIPLVACLLLSCTKGSAQSQVPTITVERKRFSRTVQADGHLKAVKSTAVKADRGPDGPMRIAWLAEDGIEVKAGEVVARLDDTELRSRMLSARDDQATAQARREKEGVLLGQARSDRERTSVSAERDLSMARAFQRKDTELYARDDIITSEIDEKLQTARAGHARAAEKVDGQVAKHKIQLVEVEGKAAAEAIARTGKGMKMLEVRAPHAGTLVWSKSWRGETMAVGDQAWGTMAEVALTEKMEAEVFVLEVEAAGLARGKRAEVVLDSRPGRIFAGKVTRVETVAKRRQFRSPTQYFGVTVSLTETDPAIMKPGQRVRARLILDESDAIVVPRPALFDGDGGWIVYRRQGKKFLPSPVKVAASTAGMITIAAGLSPGDVIALRDPGQTLNQILSAPPAGSAKGR